jgi:hypothetical protein
LKKQGGEHDMNPQEGGGPEISQWKTEGPTQKGVIYIFGAIAVKL